MEHEGFEAKPYEDSVGVWTFGHGLTWISEKESQVIVYARLMDLRNDLQADHGITGDLLDVMTEMCFQLGWNGCHNFKKMWAAIVDKDYRRAAREGLDSKWAKQTPKRALKLMNIVRQL